MKLESFDYPVIDLKRTGENINALRKQNGMTVKELQEIFGFSSPQAIYKWQWGQTLPDLPNLLVLAKIWNVSIEEILITEDQGFLFCCAISVLPVTLEYAIL